MVFWLLSCVLILLAAALWLRRPVESSPVRPKVVFCGSDGIAATSPIPRRLWSYWHGGDMPLVVRSCVANWRRHCPDWDVQLIQGDDLHRFVDPDDLPDNFDRLTPARRSDWLRLYLLARHGGVWIDASTILTASLDWMVEAQARSGAQYLGYYLEGFARRDDAPVVDSWCMAAPPGSRFVSDWHRELCRALAIGDDAYLDAMKRDGRFERLRQGISRPAYLIIHMCCQVVLDRPNRYRLQLWRAEDTAYFLQHVSHWRRLDLYRRLLLRPAPERTSPLIKLRGGERRKLEFYLSHHLYWSDSIVGRHLSGAETFA